MSEPTKQAEAKLAQPAEKQATSTTIERTAKQDNKTSVEKLLAPAKAEASKKSKRIASLLSLLGKQMAGESSNVYWTCSANTKWGPGHCTADGPFASQKEGRDSGPMCTP